MPRGSGYGHITDKDFIIAFQATFSQALRHTTSAQEASRHRDAINQSPAGSLVQFPRPGTLLQWQPQTTFAIINKEVIETTGAQSIDDKRVKFIEMEHAPLIDRMSTTDGMSDIHRFIYYARFPLSPMEVVDVFRRPLQLKTDLLLFLAYDSEFLLSISPLLKGGEAGATTIPVNNYLFDRTVYTFLAQPTYYPPQCMTLMEFVDLLPPLQFQFLGTNGTLHAHNAQLDFTFESWELAWEAELVLNAYSDLRDAIAV